MQSLTAQPQPAVAGRSTAFARGSARLRSVQRSPVARTQVVTKAAVSAPSKASKASRRRLSGSTTDA